MFTLPTTATVRLDVCIMACAPEDSMRESARLSPQIHIAGTKSDPHFFHSIDS